MTSTHGQTPRLIAIAVFFLCGLFAGTPALGQMTDKMRVSNDEKIAQLTADIEALPAEETEKRAYLNLQRVYAYQEGQDQDFARAEAKKLVRFLDLDVSEKVKAYLFYRVIDSHAADDEFEQVFRTIDAYRSQANEQNSNVRRYAIARALGKIYNALGYHERTLSIFQEVLATAEFEGLAEYQTDSIANHLTVAEQYARIGDFQSAYEAMVVAQTNLEAHLATGTFNAYIIGIVTLHVQTAMARALVDLERYEEASTRIDDILQTAKELERDRIRDRVLLLKARIQLAKENNSGALETLNLLANAETGIADSSIVNEVFEYRADVLEATGDIAGALADRKRVMLSRADEARDQNASRASFATAKLESSERQERLEELEVQNAIAKASAERSDTIALLSGLAAFLALVALIGVYRAWRTQQTARAKLQTINTELQDLSDENYRLANRDTLTDLPNRRNFVWQIDAIMDERRESQTPFSVGLLDLDGFKLVNDAYGHPAGDELLRQAAQRLSACLEGKATVARLGGDEFGFVCPAALSNAEIMTLGGTICESLAQPYQVGRHSAKVSTSVGIATFPDAGQTRSELFERADFALYHAKQSGKGHAVAFSREHESSIRSQSNMELRFHEADVENEFDLVFQPIFDAQADLIVGVEALARWHSPSLGPISPLDFIPLAENSGQIRHLTPILLRKALAAARDLPSSCYLSFNLSPKEVTSLDYASTLIGIVHEYKFEPERLVFEITETAMMREADKVIGILERFRREGIRIALDDFGDGFSAFSHLARMPLDLLKVDRVCLESIGMRKKEGTSVLQAICELSRNLGIQTVIEGIETREQLDVVQSAGLDMLQGFLLARPVDKDKLQAVFDKTYSARPRLVQLDR